MHQFNTYIGIDLGDKQHHFCLLDPQGEILKEGVFKAQAKATQQFFARYERSLVAMETGTHSRWMSQMGEEAGHEVVVANARSVRAIYSNPRKCDKIDAEMLARLVRADRALLHPIQHRGRQAQADLALLKCRDKLVQQRTNLINCIRGIVKSSGERLSSCDARYFHKKTRDEVPQDLRAALYPLYEVLENITEAIKEYERKSEARCKDEYTEVEVLRSIPGVGPITGLAFVLTLENHERFINSRDVPAFLGLVPGRSQSGDSDPEMRISKTGNRFLRRLLIGCAQYILGPFAKDCELRRWGNKIMDRGGRHAKKRAVVAVARKLSVLMHHMWATGVLWEPFPNAPRDEQAETEAEEQALAEATA